MWFKVNLLSVYYGVCNISEEVFKINSRIWRKRILRDKRTLSIYSDQIIQAHIFDLDLIRFLAIFMVTGYHV